MGLRPSMKNEDGSFHNAPASPKSQGGNSSSPSEPSSPPPPRRQAWTARGQLLLDFHHAISRAINSPEMARKCDQIAEDMSLAEWEGNATRPRRGSAPAAGSRLERHLSMAEEYGPEAALIVENKSKRDAAVRNKSLAVGLLSFATLRGGRGLGSWLRRLIANRAAHGGGSYRFDKVSSRNIEPSVESAVIEPPVSKLRKVLRLTVDVTISASMTLLSGTFLFMPRPAAYIEDMSKLPLVEGKSVYAEIVCPPLLREYRRVMEQYGGRWPVMRRENATGSDGKAQVGPQLTQEDVSLNIIRTFVENCSKRSKYERALLEERNALSSLEDESASTAVSRLIRRITRNKSTDEESQHMVDNLSADTIDRKLGTVSIPSPGVPENIPVDIDLEVFSLADEEHGVE